MVVSSPFPGVLSLSCEMDEPTKFYGHCGLQAISVVSSAGSWVDCAENHHHKQPGGRVKNVRQGG